MSLALSEAFRTEFREPRLADTLFLDRDGVLNHAIIRGAGVSSPRRWDDFRSTDDCDALLAPSVAERWNLVVITNQPDLSRGTVDMETVAGFHQALADRLPLSAIYICPHVAADQCPCRKPKAGLVEMYRRDYPDLGGREVFVGDRESDLCCAEEAGILFVLRLRPYNRSLKRRARHSIETLWDLPEVLKISENN